MNPRRFAGSALALLLALGAAGAWYASQPPTSDGSDEPVAIFDPFEKEQLVGFAVHRPEGDLAFVREGETWSTVGERWRPSASMVRRVAHQMHDLTARATVVEAPEDPSLYGLGPDAIRVALDLDDGRHLELAVGDPNPSSVSWYMRPLPDGPVYVVKKAAVDYFRLEAEAFREDRIASFDARDATSIEARVGGQELAFRRTGETAWEMTGPEQWSADRDRVRRVLGAVASLRSFAVVADQPEDRSAWGLGPDSDFVEVQLDGRSIRVHFGESIPDTDPPQRDAWHRDDDTVYAVRASVTDTLQRPLEEWRNTRVIGHNPHEVRGYRVVQGEHRVEVTRSADEWRWDQGAAIPGATPRRVAGFGSDLRALAFHDQAPPGAFDPVRASIELDFDDGSAAHIELGATFEEPGPERPTTLQYARLAGSEEVWTVEAELGKRIEDLVREHGRKADKDAERHR